MRVLVIIFIFLSSKGYSQINCQSITSSDRYFSSIGQGNSEGEARINATSSLISQISSYVTTRTDVTTQIENQFAEQNLVNQSTSISNLRLDGLKYEFCQQQKKADKIVTIVAYITKEDLEKSTAYVADDVRAYMQMIKDKKALGIGYISDLYQAYLNTFFSPYPIEYVDGGKRIDNLKLHLENELRQHLNQVELICTTVEENQINVRDHFIFNISLKNNSDPNLRFDFEIPSINAKSQLGFESGKLPVIFRPYSQSETFRGKLSLKSISLPQKLTEISNMVNISRDIEIQVDFSNLISIDFFVTFKDIYVEVSPDVKNISISNIEWFSDNKILSTDQSPRLNKSDLGKYLELRINKQLNLSKSKRIEVGLSIPNLDSFSSFDKKERSVEKQPYSSSNPKITKVTGFSHQDFIALTGFNDLKVYFDKLKSEGKIVYGRKSDFITPSSCWVILLDPSNSNIVHVLEPSSGERKDIKTGVKYSDFESQLKGMVAIWVEFY